MMFQTLKDKYRIRKNMIDNFTRKFSTNDSHLQTEYPNIKLVLLMNVHVCIYLYTMICHDIYIVVIYTLYHV